MISQCLLFLKGIFLNCRFISAIYYVVCNFFNRLQQATNKSQEISWKNIVLIWKSEVFIKRKGTNARSCRMSKCIKQKQQAAEAHHAAYRTRIEKLTSEILWNISDQSICTYYSSLSGRPDIFFRVCNFKKGPKYGLQKAGCKKNRVIFIKKVKKQPGQCNNDPVFLHSAFCNPYSGHFFKSSRP